MLFGRFLKGAAIFLAAVFLYTVLLAFFLRFGPGGLGPRLCQLGLAVILPAAFAYRFTFRKRKKLHALRRPALGLALGGLVTPGLLSPIPVLSLVAASFLALLPFAATGPFRGRLAASLRLQGGSRGEVSCSVTDFKVMCRRKYYFRCIGQAPGPIRGGVVLQRGTLAYVAVARSWVSHPGCRRRALEAARSLMKEGGMTLVPATSAEVGMLVAGEEPDGHLLALASNESETLAPLVIASRRVLRCSRPGGRPKGAETADVIIEGDGDSFRIRVLSALPTPMPGQRLRDLLDLYGMVAA